MFVRSASLLLLAMLLASPAHAKRMTFTSAAPVGIGVTAGISQNPDSDLVGKAQNTSTSFSHFFGFNPYIDMGSVVIRLAGEYHAPPVLSATGNDSTGDYSETSDLGIFVYGAQVLLVPYISENDTARAYIRLGLAQSIARGENARTYNLTQTKYTEKFQGKSRELSVGTGLEFFLIQNYTMVIEGGFRQMEFEKLERTESGTDLAGANKNKGDALTNTDGTNKKVNYSGVYGSVSFNLHF